MRVTILGLAILATIGSGVARADEPHTFTVVNTEYQNTKIWVPSTLVVHKGDTVKVKLINNVPSDPNQHGFAIPAFNVAAVVTRGEPQDIEFKADRAGVFPISCQLHPAHVAGQLIVLEK